ncbi:PilN domain-containing protein [Nodularia spumigena]|uniref:PilN domain-containing protein n=1 Tax=Nodularia spumigena TaxID=70799 RepID=UPI002B218406|nr:PilN domain-containing protein [Nodularia spumigena]MEA5557669.1 PilN domain-containing protein [Nodularia spumigena CH309]
MVKLNPFSHPSSDSAGGSFLPEDYVSRKADNRANILCLGLFAVVMAGVVSAFMVTNRQWEGVKKEQEAINASYEQESKKIAQLKDLEAQRTSMIDRGEITTALIERTPRSMLMAQLVTTLPEGITLLNTEVKSKRLAVVAPPPEAQTQTRSLSSRASKPASKSSKTSKSAKAEPPPPPRPQAPRFESTLAITGVAGENQQIADYLAALKQSQLLEAVELVYIKEAIMADMALRRFQINAKLRVLTSTPATIAVADPASQPTTEPFGPTASAQPGSAAPAGTASTNTTGLLPVQTTAAVANPGEEE